MSRLWPIVQLADALVLAVGLVDDAVVDVPAADVDDPLAPSFVVNALSWSGRSAADVVRL